MRVGKEKYRTDGYITVYFALILGLIIVLTVTVIEGARRQTIRFETECVMDAALNSIFAEYSRAMLDRYGLLFIDDSYGETGNEDNTKNHFLHYMNMNFDKGKANIMFNDITSIRVDNADLSEISFASDRDGEVLAYQIVQYMKTETGIALLDTSMYNPFETDYEEKFNDYKAQREALDEQIAQYVEDYNKTLPEGEEPVSISNPADAVEKEPNDGVLYYAFGDRQLSGKYVNTAEYISNRGYVNGYGLYDSQESPFGKAEEILYMTYLFDKLGYESKEIDNSALDYQLEYLLEGKETDISNLRNVVRKIFCIRYVTNMAYLLTDGEKKEEAKVIATIASTLIGSPEITEAVQYSILLAWGYAESAKDLRILFDGHKLSPIKTSADWNTTLAELLYFKSNLSNYKIPSNGILDYKTYLIGFLVLASDKNINMRLMDVMEMDIRLTAGNSKFRMDNQIYQMSVKANVSSSFGYGCSIKRNYSYR